MAEQVNRTAGGGSAGDVTIKSMEALLRRTQVLQGAVNAFSRDLASSNPLLPFPAMQSRLSRIQYEMTECKDTIDEHMGVISSTVLVPTQTFPFKTHPFILEALFRTRLEPHVEEWQKHAESAAIAKEDKEDREKRGGSMSTLTDKEINELWQAAGETAYVETMKHDWYEGGDYTFKEVEQGVENIRHGLKRSLQLPTSQREVDAAGSDDEDDFDEDAADPGADDPDKMHDGPSLSSALRATTETDHKPVRQAKPVDDILRFMTRGE